jgi:hypothetical protein
MKQGAYLSVAFGNKVVGVHLVDDDFGGGKAKFEIASRDGNIVLSDADDPAATTSVKGVHHALKVVAAAPADDTHFFAYGKTFPMRSVDDGFEVLTPGTGSNNLGIFFSASIKLTVHR